MESFAFQRSFTPPELGHRYTWRPTKEFSKWTIAKLKSEIRNIKSDRAGDPGAGEGTAGTTQRWRAFSRLLKIERVLLQSTAHSLVDWLQDTVGAESRLVSA